MNSSTSDSEKANFLLGINAFVSLRAEEEIWLSACFVPPLEFERIIGNHSVIVFGEPGSGKTALFHILREQSLGPNGKNNRLFVHWKPTKPQDDSQSSAAQARRQIDQILDDLGMALAKELLCHPKNFNEAPTWAQTRLFWFLHKSVQGNLAVRLGPLLDELSDNGGEMLQWIQTAEVEDILYNPSPEQMVSELLNGLKRLGIEGILAMSDGLEAYAETDQESLSASLTALLSALSLFERSGLIFKIFLPTDLEADVRRTSGVARRRVDVCYLHWDVPHLRQLVEKRLSFALGRENFTLEELCNAPGWFDWLKRVGGNSPREWLDQVQPLVRNYLKRVLTKPIDEKTWKEIRRKQPPRFWMEETGRKVVVGGRRIPLNDLPPKSFDMLRYLYQNSGKVISKEELYFLIYRGLEKIPHPSDDASFEHPKDYAGLIDTSIYRIRQAIEPDPSSPVLLQTVRGHGVRLVSRW